MVSFRLRNILLRYIMFYTGAERNATLCFELCGGGAHVPHRGGRHDARRARRGPDPRVQRTVAAVVEVGRRLLDEEGPEAVTHLRIGELTGIARTTIYRHFPDREALLEAVLAESGDAPTVEDPPPDRFDTGSLVGDLDAFLETVRRRSGRGRETQRLPHLLSHAERHGRFAELRDRRMDRLLTSLETILERARERGELDHRIEPPDAAAELLGPLFFRRFFLGQQLRTTELASARDHFLLVHGIEPPDSAA